MAPLEGRGGRRRFLSGKQLRDIGLGDLRRRGEVLLLDRMKELGFRESTRSGLFTLLDDVYKARTPLRVRDIRKDTRTATLPFDAGEFRSLLATPILLDSHLAGVILDRKQIQFNVAFSLNAFFPGFPDEHRKARIESIPSLSHDGLNAEVRHTPEFFLETKGADSRL